MTSSNKEIAEHDDAFKFGMEEGRKEAMQEMWDAINGKLTIQHDRVSYAERKVLNALHNRLIFGREAKCGTICGSVQCGEFSQDFSVIVNIDIDEDTLKKVFTSLGESGAHAFRLWKEKQEQR